MLPKPKLPRPLPKCYGTSSLFTVGCPKRSCWIGVGIVNVSWWLISVIWWEPKSCELACTTHRLMASVRGSTPLWLVCWELTPREEIRLEEPHWGVSPCLQLYPEFSYWVQLLLPDVWEATLPPCRCHLKVGTTLSYGTYHLKIHTEKVTTHEMGQ